MAELVDALGSGSSGTFTDLGIFAFTALAAEVRSVFPSACVVKEIVAPMEPATPQPIRVVLLR